MSIVELRFEGEVSLSDLNVAAKEAIELMREHDCSGVYLDATAQESAPSFAELYERPKLYEAEGLSRSIPVVYVMPRLPKVREAAHFWETVCRNRGWFIQMFENREDAMEWLKATISANKADAGGD